MSKHMPWRQAEDNFSIYVEDPNGRIVADVRDPTTHQAPIEERMEAHRALARLIAAAPEMLEALKAQRSAFCDLIDRLNRESREGISAQEYQSYVAMVERVGAAIAKAEDGP